MVFMGILDIKEIPKNRDRIKDLRIGLLHEISEIEIDD
jgi:hypothetical protein